MCLFVAQAVRVGVLIGHKHLCLSLLGTTDSSSHSSHAEEGGTYPTLPYTHNLLHRTHHYRQAAYIHLLSFFFSVRKIPFRVAKIASV